VTQYSMTRGRRSTCASIKNPRIVPIQMTLETLAETALRRDSLHLRSLVDDCGLDNSPYAG
jgi:hypothetical protein